MTDDRFLSWEEIYLLFMQHGMTRQWLFQTKPPSISEVVSSLSNAPLFFGFQMGMKRGETNSMSCILDHAGSVAAYDQVDNFMLGLSFSFNGNSLPQVGLKKVVNYPTTSQAVGTPVNRCALTHIKTMGKDAILSIKLQWLGTSGLIVDTQMFVINSQHGSSIRSQSLEYRVFPYHQAQAILRKHMQFSDGCGNATLFDPTSLFPKAPSLTMKFNDVFNGGRFLKNKSTAENKPSTGDQFPASPVSETSLQTDNRTQKNLVEESISIWTLYKTSLLVLNEQQIPVYFSIEKPAGIKSVNEYIPIFNNKFEVGLNVSTTMVMNSCLKQLLQALGIRTYSIQVDQFLLNHRPSSAAITQHEIQRQSQIRNQLQTIEGPQPPSNDVMKSPEIPTTATTRHKPHKSTHEHSNGNVFENEAKLLNTFHFKAEDQSFTNRAMDENENLKHSSSGYLEKNIDISYHKHLISKNDKSHTQVCPRCGLSIKGKKSNLMRHIANIHDKARPFVCTEPNCKVRFQNQSNLKRHVSLVHNQRMYSCDLCTRSFKSEKVYIEHTQSAHISSLTKLQCEICGGCFSKRSSLKRHFHLVHVKQASREAAPLHIE